MNPILKKALNDQVNGELAASQAYYAMALWCEDKAYAGFGKFFYKQAAEEREHAQLFAQHLLDRGARPELGTLEAPQAEFGKLTEVAALAETLEQRNSASIQHCYELALEVKDYASYPILLKLIEEQVEEEAWAANMVTLTKRAECSGATYNLDRHIVQSLESSEDDSSNAE